MLLEDFAARLRASRAVVVFTGAGISTESGIPDFRSPGGLWRRYRPVTFQEYVSSEAARIEAWKRRVEAHHAHRDARPNVGHYFVHWLHERGSLIGVITQNVDGLHGLAGVPEEKIVELHGTHRKIICLSCDRFYDPDEIIGSLRGDFASPKCSACGGILKTATVSFGQAMPQDAMRRARAWTEGAELFIVMGSSLQVQPAATFPLISKQNGALLAIVNREQTPLDDYAEFVYRGEIGEFCRKLNALIADG